MRHELTDYEWAAIKQFLPNKPRGVPRANDRRPALAVTNRRSGEDKRLRSVERLQYRYDAPTNGLNRSAAGVTPMLMPASNWKFLVT